MVRLAKVGVVFGGKPKSDSDSDKFSKADRQETLMPIEIFHSSALTSSMVNIFAPGLVVRLPRGKTDGMR